MDLETLKKLLVGVPDTGIAPPLFVQVTWSGIVSGQVTIAHLVKAVNARFLVTGTGGEVGGGITPGLLTGQTSDLISGVLRLSLGSDGTLSVLVISGSSVFTVVLDLILLP